MKNIKKIIALILAIMSIMCIAVPALAGTSTVVKGTPKYKSYSISSSPSYYIELHGKKNDKVIITLCLNDLEHPLSGDSNWKKSKTITVTLNNDGYASTTITPGTDFKYVDGRSDRARLGFQAYKYNKAPVEVTYPEN